MAHYLFNLSQGAAAKGPAPREQAAGLLRVKMWGIRADEPHRNAIAPGDLILIYLGAPEREFIGRAEIASAARDWTPSEARSYPGDSPSGVLLAQVEEWDPPVPVNTVLSQIDPAENARGDFQAGVVRITPHEYQTVLAASADAGAARSR
jgi:EVE domain-containing protein